VKYSGLTTTHLTALKAISEGRGTVTSAGFALDGETATGDLRVVFDRLWLEDLIDADLAAMDQAQTLELTEAGRQLLAHAEKEPKS
jgi:hypothetical protein